MAYTNLLDYTCAGGKAEFIQTLRDFICKRGAFSETGIGGWTIIDSSYTVDENNMQTGDWFVVQSEGTSGRDQLVFYIKWNGTSYLSIQGFCSWNVSTHVGVGQYAALANSMQLADTISNPNLWIYGNEDFVWFIEAQAFSTYRTGFLGKAKSLKESEDILLSTSATAGTDKVLTMDGTLPDDWEVGKGVFIWDGNGTQIKPIKAVDRDNNQITVDLSSDVSTSSRVSRFLGYCHQSTSNLSGVLRLSKAGAAGNFSSVYPTINYVDLSGSDAEYAMVQFSNIASGGQVGTLRNMLYTYKISPLVHKDVIEADDGTEYRFFECYGGNCCCLEV